MSDPHDQNPAQKEGSNEHDHSHAGDGHAHGASADADQGKLAIALGLIVSFLLVEVVTGIISGSLVLLSDAGHMLTDAGALAFSIAAVRLAQRPASGAKTFGLRRVEILSAQVNGMTLLIVALFVVYEAIRRLISPPEVGGTIVFIVALVGIVVNVAATWTLAKANRQSLNVEGSFQHILTDLYAFIGTAIAGAVILITGFARADSIASLIVAGLMLHSAYGLLKASGRVFLEFAPEGLDPDEIGTTLAAVEGVTEIHDLHVWEVSSGFPSLSAHVLVDEQDNCHAVRRQLERELHDRFGLDHTTLQVDHTGGELLDIETADPTARHPNHVIVTEPATPTDSTAAPSSPHTSQLAAPRPAQQRRKLSPSLGSPLGARVRSSVSDCETRNCRPERFFEPAIAATMSVCSKMI